MIFPWFRVVFVRVSGERLVESVYNVQAMTEYLAVSTATKRHLAFHGVTGLDGVTDVRVQKTNGGVLQTTHTVIKKG